MYGHCQPGPCSSINNRQHRILRELARVIPALRDHQIEIETDIRKCLGSYLINELTRVNISFYRECLNIVMKPKMTISGVHDAMNEARDIACGFIRHS